MRRGEEWGEEGEGEKHHFPKLGFQEKTLKFPFPILGKLPRKEVEDFIKFLLGKGRRGGRYKSHPGLTSGMKIQGRQLRRKRDLRKKGEGRNGKSRKKEAEVCRLRRRGMYKTEGRARRLRDVLYTGEGWVEGRK